MATTWAQISVWPAVYHFSRPAGGCAHSREIIVIVIFLPAGRLCNDRSAGLAQAGRWLCSSLSRTCKDWPAGLAQAGRCQFPANIFKCTSWPWKLQLSVRPAIIVPAVLTGRQRLLRPAGGCADFLAKIFRCQFITSWPRVLQV